MRIVPSLVFQKNLAQFDFLKDTERRSRQRVFRISEKPAQAQHKFAKPSVLTRYFREFAVQTGLRLTFSAAFLYSSTPYALLIMSSIAFGVMRSGRPSCFASRARSSALPSLPVKPSS